MTGDRDLEKRVLALETLLDLSQSFILFAKLEELGNFLLLTLIGQFSFARAAIFLERWTHHGALPPVAARGIEKSRLSHCELAWTSGIGKAVRDSEGAFVDLATLAQAEPGDNVARELFALGFRTAVPVAAKGHAIGLILVGDRVSHEEFSPLDRQMLVSTIEIAAVAIENSLLYESLRRSNEELTSKNVRLEEMNRLQAEFLQNTSHELRTPLTVILSYAEFLKLPEVGHASRVEFSENILLNGERLLSLIERLLALASLSASRTGVAAALVDVNGLLAEEVELARPAAERAKLTLVVNGSPDVGAAVLDSGRTREIIRSLVDNAIKFTPEAGRVEVSSATGDREILVRVRDTGIGIAPEDHQIIFDRFRQLDGSTTRAYGGVGIGLSIAKELAELQGGRISVESALGQGSVFTLHLPARVASNTASAVLAA
ncbi:MAG: ATP-binding protein [bacterium]